MKKPLYVFVVFFILLLGIVPAFAAPVVAHPPGKGEITVKPGGAITSLTVRYNIDNLMGEPLVTAAYKWDSPTRSEIDYNTVVWLTIQDNLISTNTAFIRIGDGVPGKRGEWSMDCTGSNSWGTVLTQTWSGPAALDYVEADIAKQYWRNGFKVIGAELSRSYESILPQDPKNYFGQWTHWEPLKDEPNIFFRLMCERYDAASQKYVWRMQIWRKSVRQVSMRVRLDDDFNKQKGTDYKAVNIQSDAKVEFPPTYLAVGRAHPNGGAGLPVSVNFTAEFTELQEPQQQQQPKPQPQQPKPQPQQPAQVQKPAPSPSAGQGRYVGKWWCGYSEATALFMTIEEIDGRLKVTSFTQTDFPRKWDYTSRVSDEKYENGQFSFVGRSRKDGQVFLSVLLRPEKSYIYVDYIWGEHKKEGLLLNKQ